MWLIFGTNIHSFTTIDSRFLAVFEMSLDIVKKLIESLKGLQIRSWVWCYMFMITIP